MSNAQSTLLVELLTEELPPKALARLGDAFAQGITHGLRNRGLLDDDATASSSATPRRLAVSIQGVRAKAPDTTVRAKVLPVSVALNANGEPAPPLAKKLAALGFPDLPMSALERANDGKAEAFFHTYTSPGAALTDGLQAALDDTLGKLPIPKVMSYQRPDGATVQFVRPAHGLIALHNDTVVPITALGLRAGNTTLGHRFLSQRDIVLTDAGSYAATLASQGKVIASYGERKEEIRRQLLAKAGSDHVVMPEALLDEVTALVEWPVIYECHFDAAFLAVPQECLILTMQTNQKYFALTDKPLADGGRLRNRFLIVSNIATPTPEHIVAGNERVVRPRLADAKFFFEQDKKKKLADRVPLLSNVVYHNKLGSQLQRVERLHQLSDEIACLLGASSDDIKHAKRAAQICKADLLTDMVAEFPELQGTMGTYYARHDGEPEDVAQACSEHYRPRFAGDDLPATVAGTVVALADKLETLVGIWGIGLQPTGEKDPFALRRHALGVLRILIEKRLPAELPKLLELARDEFDSQLPAGTINATATNQLYAFLLDRLRSYLKDKGYAFNDIEAVLSQNPTRMDDVLARVDAVRAFSALPEAEALAAANKRIGNILRKANEAGEAAGANVEPALLKESAEQALAAEVAKTAPVVQARLDERRYADALATLAQLRESVDAFFDDVMVMADDTALRNNRLALLAQLHAQMNCVADISKLAA